MAYGELGPTHHSIEDLAWLRAIANLPVIVPGRPDRDRAGDPLGGRHRGPDVHPHRAACRCRTIHARRLHVRARPVATRLRDGGDVTIIACGTMVERALDAADLLAARGVGARVLNMPTVRPLDRRGGRRRGRARPGAIVTVEEHTVHGGLGGAVAEVVATERPVPMRLLGVPGVFAPTGSTRGAVPALRADRRRDRRRGARAGREGRGVTRAGDRPGHVEHQGACWSATTGEILARASVADRLRRIPRPGWVEQDAEEIWQSVADA